MPGDLSGAVPCHPDAVQVASASRSVSAAMQDPLQQAETDLSETVPEPVQSAHRSHTLLQLPTLSADDDCDSDSDSDVDGGEDQGSPPPAALSTVPGMQASAAGHGIPDGRTVAGCQGRCRLVSNYAEPTLMPRPPLVLQKPTGNRTLFRQYTSLPCHFDSILNGLPDCDDHVL